jgi:uncharacterized protein YlaI
MASQLKCERCGDPGELVSFTDSFGELRNRKINICLCKECEGLRLARDPEFMAWLVGNLSRLTS